MADIPLTPVGSHLAIGTIRFQLSMCFMGYIGTGLGVLLCESTQAAYNISRTIAGVNFIGWAANAYHKSVFEAMDGSYFKKTGANTDATADYSGMIGVCFMNMIVFFGLGCLFYGPILYYDFWMKTTVENVIEDKMLTGKLDEAGMEAAS